MREPRRTRGIHGNRLTTFPTIDKNAAFELRVSIRTPSPTKRFFVILQLLFILGSLPTCPKLLGRLKSGFDTFHRIKK